MLIMGMKIVDDLAHAVKWEVVRIISEDPSLVHIIDFASGVVSEQAPSKAEHSRLTVCPHGLQGNSCE